MEQPETQPVPASRTSWAWISGTLFGIGLIGKGSGTVASVVTAPIWWTAARYFSPSQSNLAIATGVAAAISILVGIPAGATVARELRRKDPGEVVIDEVAGQLIALIGALAATLNWK